MRTYKEIVKNYILIFSKLNKLFSIEVIDRNPIAYFMYDRHAVSLW